ncbi:hypothetical protein ACS0TY_033781 [Phlomoides rotata]
MGEGIEADGLKKLEYLSLVSKVCTELETHLGFGDKVLDEFITEMGRNCQNMDEFDAQLKENGAEMPDYFVQTLLTIIHVILPPKPKSKSDKGSTNEGDDSFSALKIKDGKERVKELEKEIEDEAKARRRLGEDAEEEKYRDRVRDDERRERRDIDKEKDRERVRYGDKEDRGRHRDREDKNRSMYKDGEEKGRRKHGSRDMDGYGEEKGRRKHGDINRNRGEYDNERDDERRESKNNQLEEPELGKGGLVHVSQMATKRISNAKKVVKRDQEVYVKVISRSEMDDGLIANPSSRNGRNDGSRIGLSGIKITEEDDVVPSRRPLKRMSSPERWEAKQLIASGVMIVKEYHMFDEEGDGY